MSNSLFVSVFFLNKLEADVFIEIALYYLRKRIPYFILFYFSYDRFKILSPLKK